MRLTINGDVKDLDAGTVEQVLDVLGLPKERVAVEHNGRIIRRGDRAATAVVDGDRLEVVTLVGGG